MTNYILGVDGGNTKTDYFLFDTEGNFYDYIRGATASHEGLEDGFKGTKRVLKEYCTKLLEQNGLTINDLSSSVFGLAGVDTPFQKKSIENEIKDLGFKNFKVVNDSFLGIKAINSYGVCSICGTGTSSGGIGIDGKYLQVGGIGAIVGDEAGGSFLARRAIRQTFDSLYRFGKPSLIDNIVLEELNVKDKYYLMEAISEKLERKEINLEKLCKAVFECANKGDEVCIDMLKEMANSLARSCGGCITNLSLGDNPLVVLAGSVWAKGSNPTLVNEFKKLINQYTNKECDVRVLTLPPCTGAICWAIELYNGTYPNNEMRIKISDAIKKKVN